MVLREGVWYGRTLHTYRYILVSYFTVISSITDSVVVVCIGEYCRMQLFFPSATVVEADNEIDFVILSESSIIIFQSINQRMNSILDSVAIAMHISKTVNIANANDTQV